MGFGLAAASRTSCLKYTLIAVLTYLTWLSRILLSSFGSTKVLYAMA